MTYKIPNSHNPNLPWRVDRSYEGSSTIVDSTGIPVAMGLRYTSLKSGKVSESGAIYNASEYAGPIRAEMIVAAINSLYPAK